MAQRESNRLNQLAYISRHSSIIAYFVACVALFILLAITSVVIFQSAVYRQVQTQTNVAQKLEAVSKDVGSLLIGLAKTNNTSCTHSNLLRLNRLVFEHHYVRGVGIYNDQGQLYCTTETGRLQSGLISQSSSKFETHNGFKLHLNSPALLFNENRNLVVVNYGRFDAIIDPYVTKSIFQNYPGIIWFLNRGLIPLKISSSYSSHLVERMRQNALTMREGPHYNWLSASANIIQVLPKDGELFDGNVILESHISFFNVISHAMPEVTLAITTAIIFGIFVFGFVLPRLRNLNSLPNKIQYLCTEGHISCLYQPIINLKTGMVIGCEVLMRLFDDDGKYSPDQVLPFIKAAGLTWKLDSTITSIALGELAPYMRGKEKFKVCFNFFPDDLQDMERLLAHFQGLHDRFDTSRLKISIEILEHNISGDEVQTAVACLKSAGYCVAVDDFGTGYSNLGSLKKLMPDILKIDRSFVFDMEDTSVRSSLIPEVVSIARAVGADVVAEGIENNAQATKLIELGVDYGQGYLYSKPVPIKEFIAFYHKHQDIGLLGVVPENVMSIQKKKMAQSRTVIKKQLLAGV